MDWRPVHGVLPDIAACSQDMDETINRFLYFVSCQYCTLFHSRGQDTVYIYRYLRLNWKSHIHCPGGGCLLFVFIIGLPGFTETWGGDCVAFCPHPELMSSVNGEAGPLEKKQKQAGLEPSPLQFISDSIFSYPVYCIFVTCITWISWVTAYYYPNTQLQYSTASLWHYFAVHYGSVLL